MKGINNKILKVDLTNKNFTIDEQPDEFYRKYIGGRGFALYYMHKDMPSGVDPLSEENMLVFATSIIVGAPGPAIPRLIVCGKSPLTNAFGESEAGGFFAPELKKAGFDAIILTGKAEKPSYLWIKDGEVEIRSAEHLWGKTTKEAQDIILEELEDDRVRVAQIGPGGENLVKYGNITNNLAHFNGRNGLGAVMGSKNLKAIAARGTQDIPLADKERVKEITKWTAKEGMKNPKAKTLRELGTLAGVNPFNEMGVLPTKNWNKSVFENAYNISGENFSETIGQSPKGCYSCPIRCKRVAQYDNNVQVDPEYGGPEYESMVSLGSLLEIDNINLIAKANELCNKYTVDTISAGMTIAFAMECYENGLLSQEECDDLKLNFGNEEVLLPLIEKIAKREGIGDLLAEGSYRAAKKIGQEAFKYVHHAKKQEVPMHDPRVKTGVGLQYATADYGADHMKAVHDSYFSEEDSIGTKTTKTLGVYHSLDPKAIDMEKVALYVKLDKFWSLIDALGACCFGFEPRGPVPIDMLMDLIKSITGVDFSLWELMQGSERTINMARLFNQREGITSEKDALPEKFFENFSEGPLSGTSGIDKNAFNEAIKARNKMMGWDKDTGVPSEEKLAELGLSWIKD